MLDGIRRAVSKSLSNDNKQRWFCGGAKAYDHDPSRGIGVTFEILCRTEISITGQDVM